MHENRISLHLFESFFNFQYIKISPLRLNLSPKLLFLYVILGDIFYIPFLDVLLLVYRNTTVVRMLILCPATLVNLSIKSKSFWLCILGFLYMRSCHLQTLII